MQFGYAIKTAHGMGLFGQTCNRGEPVVVTYQAGDTIGQVRCTNAQDLLGLRCGKRWTPGPI